MNKYFCDKCKEHINPQELFMFRGQSISQIVSLDLCEFCYNHIMKELQ